MKKIIPLSLLAVSYLVANDLQVDTINVESTVISEVAENAQTSADVAKALSDKVPSIDMNRRSGIANDIYIRGQKRDNIVVEVDGTKVCGACPNRMDPPTSHIVANQVDKITVIEGPYDVESFGVLSGGVKIETKKPTKDLKGSINLGFGAWNYRKFGATVSGGNDFIRMIATVSDESSDQYKDGNGDTLAEQVDNYGTSLFTPTYHDVPAYKKKSAMAKAFITTAENQELRLSVTANRSDDVLYPNSKMDARYDDSNIYSIEYNIDSINENYKNVNLQYYYSDVDHPMDTMYRTPYTSPTSAYMTNHLKTTMQGLKLKNNFDIMAHEILIGLDTSKRTWEGEKYKTTFSTGIVTPMGISLEHTETENAAVFAKLKKSYADLDVEIGARYDDTTITNPVYQNNNYTAFSANIMTTYNINKENKIFLGIGQASRVPDARELYMLHDTPNTSRSLKQVTNQEIDLGYDTDNKYFKLKAKAFYSMLNDNLILNSGNDNNSSNDYFENVDTTLYGAELSASVYATDDITIDMGASYKVGEKDRPLNGQTGTNLADVAPLRGNIGVNYEYRNNSMATLELQASDRWDTFDEENGEQEIAGWAVVNAKVKHAVNKKFDLTIGMNNIFDVTYAVNNTYKDLTLLVAGTSEVMLLNEPGRYFYTNLDFKF